MAIRELNFMEISKNDTDKKIHEFPWPNTSMFSLCYVYSSVEYFSLKVDVRQMLLFN